MLTEYDELRPAALYPAFIITLEVAMMPPSPVRQCANTQCDSSVYY